MSRGNRYAVQSDPDRNPNFRRAWNEPQPIGPIVQEITRDAALKAIGRMLTLAAEATGEDRETSFAAANEIRKTAGLDWGDVLWREVA